MPKLKAGDTVMLSTLDDAWSPEARKHGVGCKSLEALLKNTPAQIRILTKSAEVAKDFDVIKGFEKRVMVGLSIGIPDSREDVAAAVEPNASPIRERMKALKLAHDQGFRTYAMLCPCLPGVADTEAALTEMFKAVKVRGAEDIWLEPVNARGKALLNTATALRLAGLKAEADAVDAIRTKEAWSKYATALTENAVKVAESLGMLEKLHVLMYAAGLTAGDLGRVKALGACVTLLGHDAAVSGKRDHESEPGAESGAVENGGTGKAAGAHDTAA
jgi:DNA repair photolyase